MRRTLAAAEEEIRELREELHRVANLAQSSVPLAEMHRQLDLLGAPREGGGRPLFIRERFEWVRRKMFGG